MSMIDLDAFEAFVEAMDDALSASGYDIGKVLRHLDNNGFEIKRKLVPVVEPFFEPVPQVPSPQWPPRGITRLWATNMEPIRDVMSEVYSPSELKFVMERGASLIDATTSDEARSLWRDRGAATESSFTVDGVNYLYIKDSIPF